MNINKNFPKKEKKIVFSDNKRVKSKEPFILDLSLKKTLEEKPEKKFKKILFPKFNFFKKKNLYPYVVGTRFRSEKVGLRFHLPKLSKIIKFGLTCFFILFLIFGPRFYYKYLKIKDTVLSYSVLAASNLNLAKESLVNFDINSANLEFQEASNNFSLAQNELKRLQPLLCLAGLISPQVRSSRNLLETGEHMALAGKHLTSGLKFSENGLNLNYNNQEEYLKTLALNLINNQEEFKKTFEEISKTEEFANKVDLKYLPKDIQDKFKELDEKIPVFKKGAEVLYLSSKSFSDVLGFNSPRKYLILFQNNNEMRASGGFIGSYGILEIEAAKIKNLKVEDIYKLDAPYVKKVSSGLEERYAPPYPMNPEVTGPWAMRDSNFSPDFLVSAQKSEWFYNKESGDNVDGVISFTPTVYEELLKVIGPIELPEYKLRLTSSNFIETLQLEVEAGIDKKNYKNPKTILSVLAPKILEKIYNSNPDELSGLGEVFYRMSEEKQILFYFHNQDTQKLVEILDFAGRVKETDNDFLMVINSNYGGGKSSLFIDEKINLQSQIQQDGTVTNILTLERTHTNDYKYHYYDNFAKRWRWLIDKNRNYTKVYVPKDSQLLDSGGEKVDIKSELGKTAFGIWTSVEPKHSKTVTLKYILPFKLERLKKDNYFNYSLLIQKQAGSIDSKFKTEIITSFGKIIKTFSEELKTENNLANYKVTLNIDKFLGLILEKS